MASGAIKKTDLTKLIAAVRADGRFYGPVRGPEGVCLAELGPNDEAVIGYANFKLPPKRYFFPRSEVICTYEADSMTETPLAEEKVVIFGIRPCDARALLYLDKVFLGEPFIDPYYGRRRDNSVVISLACGEPLPTCFCTSVGASPAGSEGADMLAFDVGDSLLFETVTERGEAFMEAHSGLFAEPTAEEVTARDEQASAAEKRVPAVDVSGITEKLQEIFDSPIWEEITQRCIGCGVCTCLCPTCHCFGLYDERDGLKGRRIRAQDACMFPAFTAEASGHNPRASRAQRMRQRVMHKFRYTVETFGDIFCVGCGRCISNCPVNTDIRETVAEAIK